MESKGKKRAMWLRLGMYRVAIDHVSRVDRGSFAVRLGMFRTSIRHVLWHLMWSVDGWFYSFGDKVLIFNGLHKMLRIAYMRPRASVLGKNSVDGCIGCCGFSFPDMLVVWWWKFFLLSRKIYRYLPSATCGCFVLPSFWSSWVLVALNLCFRLVVCRNHRNFACGW